jgi:hypothetical protein
MAESNGSEYIPQRRQGAKGNQVSFWRDANLSLCGEHNRFSKIAVAAAARLWY